MDAGTPGRRRSALGRHTLLCLALVPFGTAVAARLAPEAAGSTPRPATARRDTPPIVFDQYLVDLGESREQSLVFGWFRFENRSRHAIHVRELHPSCGCLNPQLRERDYAAGESGEFYVRVQTANETSGPHEYTIGFEYETLDANGRSVDAEPRWETLRFKVILPERKVTVEPRALAFYQLDGHETRREIVVRDFREQRLEVTSVRCASPLVEAALVDSRDESGHRRHVIAIKVGGTVPAGTTWETVEIHTDDTSAPILRVPLQIRGPETGVTALGGARPASWP